jgi:hypothetical protein
VSQRYQKEIEEILENVNEDAPTSSGSGRQLRPWEVARAQSLQASGKRPRNLSLRPSVGKTLLAGVVLLILSPLLGGLGLMAPAAWGGILLIIGAYVVYFMRPRPTVERRWRGQSIEDVPEPNGFSRMWRWINRS